MTIPTARQEINANPSKNAVTAPVLKDKKDADVARKLKLYGIFQAFRQGSLPSNKQIDKALLYAEKASPVNISNLSPDGRKLVDDIRDIIETARLMILTKNDDELFQNFVFHTQETDVSRGAQSKDALPTSKDAVQNDAQNAAVHLRTLLTLVLTNSEFRKILSDLGLVGRDLFATAAAKTAEKARPDEDQLNQVDQEAPSNQWVSKDGQKVGTGETPTLQANVGGHTVEHDPKAPASEGTKHVDPNGNTTTAGEAKEKYDEAQQAKEDAKGQAKGGLKQAAQEGKQAYDQGGKEGLKQRAVEGKEQAKGAAQEADANTSDADKQNPKETAKSKFAAFKDKITPNDDKRGKVGEQRDRAKDFLDEEFPEERREQFIYRLKKVVVECQKHNDYDDAINFFLDKAEAYKGHSKHLAGKGAESTGAVAEDPAFQQAYTEFKTLLERFADGRSLNGVIDAVNALYTDADNDPELRHWFSRLSQYVRACLVEPGYIVEDESTREGKQLKETGKKFFDHKYAAHKDNLFNAIGDWFKAMGNDPVNQRFGEDWKRLTKDLLFDDNGSLEFKSHLWNDIREEILPSLVQNIGYVPIPRIEYTDKQIDLVIENLVLEGTNLIPNIVSAEAHNSIRFSPYKSIQDQSAHRFKIGLSQIQLDMRDVGFAFKKKTGFPKLSDRGLADVLVSGSGVSVDIDLASAGKRQDHAFLIKNVYANVDSLKFHIRESKHDFLYKVVAPLAQGLIRKAVGKAIEQAIKTGLEYVDEQLVGVKRAMDQAKESDDTSRTEVLKDIFKKKQQKAEDRKEKAEQKADERNSQFAVVTEKKDSVIPQVNPPHSTAQAAFSKEEIAKQGQGWKSEAFSIV